MLGQNEIVSWTTEFQEGLSMNFIRWSRLSIFCGTKYIFVWSWCRYQVIETRKSEDVNVKLEFAAEKFQTTSENISAFIASCPLWMKLSIGGSLLAYLHVRRKWTALNDCGIDVLTPKVWTLGTMGQYFVKDGYVKWTKEELLDKNRKTVAFYRGVTPIIITGKGHKCTSCH